MDAAGPDGGGCDPSVAAAGIKARRECNHPIALLGALALPATRRSTLAFRYAPDMAGHGHVFAGIAVPELPEVHRRRHQYRVCRCHHAGRRGLFYARYGISDTGGALCGCTAGWGGSGNSDTLSPLLGLCRLCTDGQQRRATSQYARAEIPLFVHLPWSGVPHRRICQIGRAAGYSLGR